MNVTLDDNVRYFAYEYAHAKNKVARLECEDPYNYEAQEQAESRANAAASIVMLYVLEGLGIEPEPKTKKNNRRVWNIPAGVCDKN